VTSKKAGKGLEGALDYKSEMEDFRETIGELYYEKAVKLMEEVEERRKEEEMLLIAEQAGKFRKSLTRKEKGGDGTAANKGESGQSKDQSNNPSPALDENAIKERIEKAGNVFKKFNSLLSKKQELLLNKLIYNDSMHIDVAVE